MKSIDKHIFLCITLLALVASSCKEDIDDSDLYTFTGEMMIDHFENSPDTFSYYYQILGIVHPSSKSESTMKELLSARGNYTCFAPTNEAIQSYLDSLYEIGILESSALDDITDSVAEAIVFNSIIDNGDNTAYASTDFQDPMPTNNMNDRPIRISYGNSYELTNAGDSTLITDIYVNIYSKVIEKDIEVENGYIHTINHVISPSNASVGDLVSNTENLSFFGSLLVLTGWDQETTDYRDYDYDDLDEAGEYYTGSSGSWGGYYPEHRYYKYTFFVEPDSVFENAGITTVDELMAYLQENADYDDDTSWDDDYESEDNALNQFIAYHIVPVGLDWSNMVTWSNEYGFYNGNLNDGSSFRVNVWEYWETIGKHRRSMKITGISGNRKRINRKSVYNTTSYREISAQITIPGITVNQTNGDYDNNALNGYYFTIDEILVWTDEIPNTILNERMRYDICSLLPEMINAGCRLNRNNSWYFTTEYFDNIVDMSDQTEFEYLPNTSGSGGNGSWMNFQSDEFNIRGIYDFTMKLPPVPYTGTYEIRYGINANSNRGMAQVYIGTNPNNLPAIGIPLDLRILGSSSLIGWTSDDDLGSDDAINEFDKQMRNNGYMKGPKYFCPGSGVTGRDCTNCMRRIIYTGQLTAGETYYIRFKSVLDDSETEFFYDYLEFVPKSIYNGDVAEDKW